MANNNEYDLTFTTTAGTYKLGTITIDGVVYRIKQDEESKELVKQLYSGTLVDAVVPDDVTSLKSYLFYHNNTLQSIDFNNVKEIPQSCCNYCTNLKEIHFNPQTKVIGAEAFRDCIKITDLSIPHTITRIDSYAFYDVGWDYQTNTHTFDFIDDDNVKTYVGDYAFAQSHLSHLKLNAADVAQYSFFSCDSLLEVELLIKHGVIHDYAFHGCDNVEKFTFDSNSVVTYLGINVFEYLCSSKANAIVSEFDMSKSTFTALRYGVWGYCKFNGDITMPSTLTTINGNFLDNAQGNWIVKFNSVPTVNYPSCLRNDTSNFTVKYGFPYELLEQAKSATNWATHTSQIVCYDKGYATGTILPLYNRSSGVAISWFKDANLTTPITVSEGENITYYCSVGTTRVVWFIDTPTLIDGAVSISDGTNTYNVGDAVPINTQLTITPSYTDNTKTILYMLTVNGVDYTSSGSATITMTQDLAITVIYWNGTDQPMFPNLADNSWASLIKASKNHTLLSTWNAGDEKVAMVDGQPYLARLVDKTGKFRRVSDNSIAWLTFEFTELLPTTQKYNSSGNNRPLQSPLLVDINSGTIYNSIDTDLTSVVESVKVIVSQGGGSGVENTLVEFEGKFFLPRERDLFATRGWSTQAEWDAIERQDEYYQTHNTDADRKKHLKGQTSGSPYWEISPAEDFVDVVCCLGNDGYESGIESSTSNGVGLRFAI